MKREGFSTSVVVQEVQLRTILFSLSLSLSLTDPSELHSVLDTGEYGQQEDELAMASGLSLSLSLSSARRTAQILILSKSSQGS